MLSTGPYITLLTPMFEALAKLEVPQRVAVLEGIAARLDDLGYTQMAVVMRAAVDAQISVSKGGGVLVKDRAKTVLGRRHTDKM